MKRKKTGKYIATGHVTDNWQIFSTLKGLFVPLA